MSRKAKKPLRPVPERARLATGVVALAPPEAITTAPKTYRPRVVWMSLGLIAVTLLLYARTAQFSSIDLDDQAMVYSNPAVSNGLTRQGIEWAFTDVKTFYWQPLTWLSHMLDCQIFGPNPGPHHLVNVGLHAINAALLFLLLLHVTGAFWRSALTAAIFAFHPLRVESVAWISERRDVLSGLFSLITLWVYVRYAERSSSRKRYAAVIVAFWLALMSKPMTVTLPLAMLLMDYWPLKRFARTPARQLLREKIPLFVSAALGAAVTFAGSYSQANPISLEILPFRLRLASAITAYTGYLAKFVWPRPLAIFYPWAVPSSAALVTAGFVFVLLSGIAVWSWRRKPYVLAGWLWFVLLLLPVIGFVQVGWQYMADRFTYLPLIGPTFAVVWLGSDWLASRSRLRRAVTAAAAIVLLAFGALSWVQIGYWKDKFTVYRHAIDVNPNNERMWAFYGKVLAEDGNLGEAERAYREAIRIRPERADDHDALAALLLRQGRAGDAIGELRQVVRLEPENVPALKYLGLALIQAGGAEEAQQHLQAAARLAPGDTEITRLLSLASVLRPAQAAAPPTVAVPPQTSEESPPVPQGPTLHPLDTEQSLEIGAVLAFVVLAVLWPAWGKRPLQWVGEWMARLARRPVRAMLFVALLPMAVRLMLLPIYGIPQPVIADEFGHLLLADTFASGNMANPPHPMREHFESIYVLQSPSYTSIYPVAQGLLLAVPKFFGMHPWFGVWLSVGLMCASIYWMLAGWMPQRWALLGAVLAALRLGVLSHWMNTYWGGAVAAIGGALVLGALPRIFRGRVGYHAAVLGLGLGILAQSRPYEGFLLAIPAGVALLVWLLRTESVSWKVRLRGVVLPLAAVVSCVVAFTAYYNWRVTGNPLQLPYLLYQKLYGVPQSFYWQQPVPPGNSVQLPEIAANYRWQLDRHNVRDSLTEMAKVAGEKLESLWMFYLQPAWTLPLMALPWIWKDRRLRFLLLAGAFVLAGVALYPLLYPHYLAPICAVFVAVVVQGIRHLRLWQWRNRPVGASLACGILILSATGLVTAPAGADLLSANLVTTRTPRSRILEKLEERGGRHLIIVHYGPAHLFHIGWIYNAADIDNSPVVWARDLGPAKNAELIKYYRGRSIWYFDADASQVHLEPYPAEPAAGSLSLAREPEANPVPPRR